MQHRRKKVVFHPSAPRPPEVEIAIAPRLEHKEEYDENTDQHQRHGRGFGCRERDRQRNSQRDDGPIRCGVQPRAPVRRPIDFATIKMAQRGDLGRSQCLAGLQALVVVQKKPPAMHRLCYGTTASKWSKKSGPEGRCRIGWAAVSAYQTIRSGRTVTDLAKSSTIWLNMSPRRGHASRRHFRFKYNLLR